VEQRKKNALQALPVHALACSRAGGDRKIRCRLRHEGATNRHQPEDQPRTPAGYDCPPGNKAATDFTHHIGIKIIICLDGGMIGPDHRRGRPSPRLQICGCSRSSPSRDQHRSKRRNSGTCRPESSGKQHPSDRYYKHGEAAFRVGRSSPG